MGALINLAGKRFGMLTVIKRASQNGKQGEPKWLCRCDCGNTAIAYGRQLREGKTKSCGCMRYIPTMQPHYIHGGAKTRLFRIWQLMISRCTCKTNSDYRKYGKRGISVCDEWKSSFISFRDWALSHGYSDSLSIDRINNGGNYEPTNCRWATEKQQARNKRNTIYVLMDGRKTSLCDACDMLHINIKRAYYRYDMGLRISERIERLDGKEQKQPRPYHKHEQPCGCKQKEIC